MTDTKEHDIFSRLNAAIQAWDTEVATSQEVLFEQLDNAKTRLVEMLENSSGTAGSQSTTTQIQQELCERDARITELENRINAPREDSDPEEAQDVVIALESQVDALQAQLNVAQEQIASREEQSHVLQGELKALRDQFEAQTIERQSELDGRDLAELRRQLEQTLQERDEALAALSAQQAPLHNTTSESEGFMASLAESTADRGVPHQDSLAFEAFDGQGHKKRMGEILFDAGIITEEQLKDVISEQSSEPQHRFGSVVVERGYTNEDVISRILAAQLRLSFVDLQHTEIDADAPPLISAHLAGLHRCIPLRQDGEQLVVAMANPLDLIAIEDIELASKCRIEPVVASPHLIDASIDRFYPQD
jgi:predicted  nucleic acid-binding Zn-ribbon protein